MSTMRVKIDVNELVRRAGVLADDLLKFRERNIEIPEYAYDISVGLEILTGYLRAISARVREIQDPYLSRLLKDINLMEGEKDDGEMQVL